MNIVYVALAGFAGGIANGLIGWAKSGEPFDFRKFLPTFLRAGGAGVLLVISEPLIQTLALWPAVIGAFFASAGFDDVWHRLAGTIKKV